VETSFAQLQHTGLNLEQSGKSWNKKIEKGRGTDERIYPKKDIDG